MGAVDYAQAWRDLRDHILEKPHHGQRELLTAMAQLESANQRDRDAYERFLDQFGEELEDAVLQLTTQPAANGPITGLPARSTAMPGPPHRRSATGHEGESHGDPSGNAAQHPARAGGRALR